VFAIPAFPIALGPAAYFCFVFSRRAPLAVSAAGKFRLAIVWAIVWAIVGAATRNFRSRPERSWRHDTAEDRICARSDFAPRLPISHCLPQQRLDCHQRNCDDNHRAKDQSDRVDDPAVSSFCPTAPHLIAPTGVHNAQLGRCSMVRSRGAFTARQTKESPVAGATVDQG
jgi:hypothetical protein